MESTDERFMKEALKQAKKAYDAGEVPIGAVIVYEGRIIGRGYNRRNTDRVSLAHAEITAIKKASKKLGDWRLEGCTIYITLEPCPMCAGAIVQSRIDRCVFACASDKAGAAGSVINLLDVKELNHQVDCTSGVLEKDCRELLQRFFRELRERV
ncbi:MAG: tRNA adenosine(34) deaminase TadA [Lachnospiraceae bacterium]|nr:tRNA adenosine(34) deaminase TadA [Lachnospiraceae bacterium]